MKKAILSIFFLCSFYCTLQAQFITEDTEIGVTFSGLGMHDAGRNIDNLKDLYGKNNFSFGFTYIRPISKRFDVEAGFEYSKYIYGVNIPNPNFETLEHSIFEIPVTLRFNFFRYFFLNGGLLVDINGLYNSIFSANDHYPTHSDLYGIGAMLGVGVKYEFKNVPIDLFLNPYYKYRSYSMPLLSLGSSAEIKNPRNTLENGFRVGVVYRF
ncbi:MAG: outer membrane beta-barrel protein [Dysgonamonadaceae bacterium]|jgi:hypothetical protein|nr:outer membrane beta-barrel protein [Dysgonamonadaceae bacterium]